MSVHAAFDLVRDETIPEIGSEVRLYRHKKTGAEVLSFVNDDENKVFGITFKTPPEDSSGVAHILEHSVLCGSRKYPVKKPFVELIKSSMNTFLNAMTFPDKTAYPVASQNLQDFYNLVDVYLDAVFFPLISEDTFRQEGWHYEADGTQMPLSFKGVVFNEMKGAYSSPAAVLGKLSQQSLYPDNAYGVNSGGDPKAIPDLTYSYFKGFHKRFYHPSNARIVFYDDDPADRLLETLAMLAKDGLDPLTVEASMNSFEFALRENNTGSFPRGMALMFRTMRNWLHGGDPFESLTYEKPLQAVKAKLASGTKVFEGLIKTTLVDNTHRTTVLLKADPNLAAEEVADERSRLDEVAAGMDEDEREDVVEITAKLKALQDEPDPPAALAKIPTLGLKDLDRTNKPLPIERGSVSGARLYTHLLPTNGVIYLDLAFDLRRIPAELVPYLSIFSRALFQTGTAKEDFVSLMQRIGRSTGGVGASRSIGVMRDTKTTTAWFFVRGKAVPDKAPELLSLITDVLTSARLDNRERIKQMLLEEKAGFASSIAGRGSGIVASRLSAAFHPASWANEASGGTEYLFFLRDLIKRVDSDWAGVESTLYTLRNALIDRKSMVLNVTPDASIWAKFEPELSAFVANLATAPGAPLDWPTAPRRSEGLTFPGQVNYVAKGANLYDLGYVHSGATAVALRHLNTTYLWDKVRVQGGAYGGGSGLDPFSGGFTFNSYRDPNLLQTLGAYDQAAGFLKSGVGDQDLVRSIIGAIGAIDTYRLPDAKGFTPLMWELTGNTDANRQQRREEVLGASAKDFKRLGEVLGEVAKTGKVAVLGSEAAIKAANDERGGFLAVFLV